MAVSTRRAPAQALSAPDPAVRWLTSAAARDRDVVGAKAANLANAADHGLPIVEGFAVPVTEVAAHGDMPPAGIEDAWARLSVQGRLPLVVRSSAPNEDGDATSMAGVFESVVDVVGWVAFVRAYARVVRSAGGGDMAVLVQRHLDPELSGVLFGVDPVSGRTDRIVIAAVAGGPQLLVSGAVQGRRTSLDRAGRVREVDGDPDPVLGSAERLRLLALARRARTVFGGPQDIEWAIVDRRLVLLQSRPVTATARRGEGPLLGPGPIAETFPQALSPLEQELWIPPLQQATRHVLTLTGAASKRRLRRSELVTVIEAQAVADLELFGDVRPRSRARALLDPRPHLRHLAVSWQVGRLRGALATLSGQVLDDIDHELAALSPVADLDDRALLRILDNATAYLRTLHGYEMLTGTLLDDAGQPGAAIALRAIAEGQSLGWSDEDIVARHPAALAVLPAALGPRPPLPRVSLAEAPTPGPLGRREELRLRIRWVHELTRIVVGEIGTRLVVRGALSDPAHVSRLSRRELGVALRGGPVPDRPPSAAPVPLPSRFRLAADGTVVAEASDHRAGGVGAGGGRGTGRVAFTDPAIGDVLVVRHLDPALAPLLPRLAGLVAETGSPLSHLAILARENGVPCVVGLAGARDQVAPGAVVVVDGRAGAMQVVAGDAEVVLP